MSDDRIAGRAPVRRVQAAGASKRVRFSATVKKGRYATKEKAYQAAMENIGKVRYRAAGAGVVNVIPVPFHPIIEGAELAVVAKGAERSREDNLKIAAAAKDLLQDLRAKRDSLPDGI